MADDASEAIGVDSSRPSVARMYDYYLGGKDNFAVDRTAAQKMMATVPESVQMVASNRAFLVRAVRYLAAEAGIRQPATSIEPTPEGGCTRRRRSSLGGRFRAGWR